MSGMDRMWPVSCVQSGRKGTSSKSAFLRRTVLKKKWLRRGCSGSGVCTERFPPRRRTARCNSLGGESEGRGGGDGATSGGERRKAPLLSRC